MENEKWWARTQRLIGESAIERLQAARVAVFGIGGVGSYVVEALARVGIGTLMLVDSDCVEITNLNRQLIATLDTVGQPKVEVAKARVHSICPDIEVDARYMRYDASTEAQFDLSGFSYVADCIDSVTSKLLLIERARAAQVPVISCMGAGNKLDPTRFRLADIADTSVCPLARVMRRELKKRKIEHLTVVYSDEAPVAPIDGAHTPASISFVPSAAGLVLAGEIIRSISGR